MTDVKLHTNEHLIVLANNSNLLSSLDISFTHSLFKPPPLYAHISLFFAAWAESFTKQLRKSLTEILSLISCSIFPSVTTDFQTTQDAGISSKYTCVSDGESEIFLLPAKWQITFVYM